ncbi:MAG: hypothetical protein FJ117_09385 [Deltaproteobacteria bacterium]|nr:hypothetical protein [Deltaproteobacteria bacterium]
MVLIGSQAVAQTEKGSEAMGVRGILQTNNRKTPLYDLRVRKAIAHSIDKNFCIYLALCKQSFITFFPGDGFT